MKAKSKRIHIRINKLKEHGTFGYQLIIHNKERADAKYHMWSVATLKICSVERDEDLALIAGSTLSSVAKFVATDRELCLNSMENLPCPLQFSLFLVLTPRPLY